MLGFEQKSFRLLDDENQKSEHKAFQTKRLKSGLVKYAAPEGMHDDTVIANALAHQGTLLPRDTGTRVKWSGRSLTDTGDDD